MTKKAVQKLTPREIVSFVISTIIIFTGFILFAKTTSAGRSFGNFLGPLLEGNFLVSIVTVVVLMVAILIAIGILSSLILLLIPGGNGGMKSETADYEPDTDSAPENTDEVKEAASKLADRIAGLDGSSSSFGNATVAKFDNKVLLDPQKMFGDAEEGVERIFLDPEVSFAPSDFFSEEDLKYLFSTSLGSMLIVHIANTYSAQIRSIYPNRGGDATISKGEARSSVESTDLPTNPKITSIAVSLLNDAINRSEDSFDIPDSVEKLDANSQINLIPYMFCLIAHKAARLKS